MRKTIVKILLNYDIKEKEGTFSFYIESGNNKLLHGYKIKNINNKRLSIISLITTTGICNQISNDDLDIYINYPEIVIGMDKMDDYDKIEDLLILLFKLLEGKEYTINLLADDPIVELLKDFKNFDKLEDTKGLIK